MRLAFQVACEDGFDSQTVTARARRCLQESLNTAIKTVSCDYSRGVLFLRGRLTSYYEKQSAQEAVKNLEGVIQVVNQIEVSP
jgi:osmotically-inducible protein OsmY